MEALNFGFRKKRDCTIYIAKTKALISFAITAKLICVFVFAYAKSRFSRDEAQVCPVSAVGRAFLLAFLDVQKSKKQNTVVQTGEKLFRSSCKFHNFFKLFTARKRTDFMCIAKAFIQLMHFC